LTNQLGEINVSTIIKPRWVNTIEVTRLVHHLNCTNIKDIINYGRSAMSICRKVIKSQFQINLIKAPYFDRLRNKFGAFGLNE
jgi:hypothetical protein